MHLLSSSGGDHLINELLVLKHQVKQNVNNETTGNHFSEALISSSQTAQTLHGGGGGLKCPR